VSGEFDKRLLAAALAALPLAILVAVHGYKRLGKSVGRAIGWWVGSAFGVAFSVLATASAFMKEPELGGYSIWQQIARGSALVCGVVLVVYTLLALIPSLLDSLEKRSFVSFVSARLLAASKSGFLTVISVLSILGVAVSSCALCSVTSIMGGFGHDLKRKILGNTAHVMVDLNSGRGFEHWEQVMTRLRDEIRPSGATATPVVAGDAMASSATNTAGVLLRGIEPETIGDVIGITRNIEIGKFEYLVAPERLLELREDEVIGRGPDGLPYYKGPGFELPSTFGEEAPKKKVYPGVILGRELAKSLHVMVGDEITLLSPMGELGPTGIMPRARKFRVAAIFYSGMYEYDASHAYTLLGVAQKFFDQEGRIHRIDIRVPDPEAVAAVRPAIDTAVKAGNDARAGEKGFEALRVRDWKEMNKNLFSALKLEKIATFIILSIAIAVASFCIICTLLLMVTEKSKEIAVLKALGAANGAVMWVFMLEGILIGAIGTVLGVAVALAACLGLSWTGVRLDPDVYYIDRLPVNVDAADYTLVAMAALVICTLATIYPAMTAARVRPVDGLRYE
jgi:lipoprotein-releasing system permease protein